MERPWYSHYAPGVPEQLEIPEIPLTKLLFDAVRKHPQQPAISFYGNRINYARFDDLATRFANVLVKLGAVKGDRVAIMLPNLPQAVIAYYGALKAGCVVVQTNPLYQAEELAQQIVDSGAKVLVALDLFKPRIDPIAPGTGGSPLEAVIYCGVRDYLPTVKKILYPFKAKRDGMWAPIKHPKAYEHNFVTLIEHAPVTAPLNVHLSPDDVALLQYTGGTTGLPKGVILTHRNLVANTLQCEAWLPDVVPGAERFLGVIPFFHVYGMTTCMNLAVRVGGEMILLPKFSPKEVLKTIAKRRPTLFPGIQAMYLALGNHPGAGKYKLSSIRACISGAGPLHAQVRERFEELTGATLVEGYGLSEASPVTHAGPIGGTRVDGAIGVPLPNTDAKVVDPESGDDLPQGEVGELLVKGPQVMQGYWNRSEETLDTLSGGWLHTGDMATVDENGFFYLVDRKKDMIKCGGENVYPRDVEEVLFRHPKIKEAVVAGLPDDFLGERIKAYVVLEDGETCDPQEIIDFCAEHLAKFKVPRDIAFRADLPKTIVGKVLRRLLVEEELNNDTPSLPEPSQQTADASEPKPSNEAPADDTEAAALPASGESDEKQPEAKSASTEDTANNPSEANKA
jgi:long-chain acyl-CoA synthetase